MQANIFTCEHQTADFAAGDLSITPDFSIPMEGKISTTSHRRDAGWFPGKREALGTVAVMNLQILAQMVGQL